MSELKPRITENGIDYILVGDYCILNSKLPEKHRSIGKHGMMTGNIYDGFLRVTDSSLLRSCKKCQIM